MQYWPWWIGALALGSVTVIFVLLIHRMMGVSGSWASVVNWREERQQRQVANAVRSNAAAMNNALLAATLAQFGQDVTNAALGVQSTAMPAQPRARTTSTSWTVHVTFLLAMIAGGFLAAIASGQFELTFDLGATHTRLFGEGWQEWLALTAGGVLVGFGTQMGGGCTSGHALSGVSRLAASSFVATAMFFGAAVAVSFLLEILLA